MGWTKSVSIRKAKCIARMIFTDVLVRNVEVVARPSITKILCERLEIRFITYDALPAAYVANNYPPEKFFICNPATTASFAKMTTSEHTRVGLFFIVSIYL